MGVVVDSGDAVSSERATVDAASVVDAAIFPFPPCLFIIK